jgi:hypothetical protein
VREREEQQRPFASRSVQRQTARALEFELRAALDELRAEQAKNQQLEVRWTVDFIISVP